MWCLPSCTSWSGLNAHLTLVCCVAAAASSAGPAGLQQYVDAFRQYASAFALNVTELGKLSHCWYTDLLICAVHTYNLTGTGTSILTL